VTSGRPAVIVVFGDAVVVHSCVLLRFQLIKLGIEPSGVGGGDEESASNRTCSGTFCEQPEGGEEKGALLTGETAMRPGGQQKSETGRRDRNTRVGGGLLWTLPPRCNSNPGFERGGTGGGGDLAGQAGGEDNDEVLRMDGWGRLIEMGWKTTRRVEDAVSRGHWPREVCK